MINHYLFVSLFFSIFLINFRICASQITTNKFILITSLYNETDEQRREEYITCLKKNLTNPLIEHIHILYDTSKDTYPNNFLRRLSMFNVTITFISGRPSYSSCFRIANTLYPSKKIILSNADIYFNETLYHLQNYDFYNKFLALTRWDQQRNGTLKPYFTKNKNPSIFSQDAWIFKSPLYNIKCDDIFLGTSHCDGRIAYEATKSGFIVQNPCMSIQACHLHLSNIRNYTVTPRDILITKSTPWCTLDIYKKLIFAVCEKTNINNY